MATGDLDDGLSDVRVWRPALEKFGAVTHLTVTLYDASERSLCCEPSSHSSLFSLFQEYGFVPGILRECARECLAQTAERPAVVASAYGLGVVGTSLVLGERVVGAAVAAYALVDFCQSTAIAALARQAGIPFPRLWALAQQQQPIPTRRLILHGELLQVLGDAILRENHRTRQYEDTAARLEVEAAAKDEFLAVLSHELRTPLMPILGWLHVLEAADDNPARRVKAIQSIRRNAQLQIRLVDDLLDLNRVARDKIALDVAVHDLADLVRSTLDTVEEAAARKQIELLFIDAGEPLRVEGDAGRLQQVFMNVLTNAVKFTPPDGRVRVALQREHDLATVRISDTGEGIRPEFLPHVFDMFRQQEAGTRRRHSGLGIGLALVKRLIGMHDGGVEIASEGEGLGTEVTIHLPLVRHEAHAVHPAPDPSVRPFDAMTILVVDNTEDALEVTRTMLQLLGARALVARNGREALAVVTTDRPDAVLCELRLPEMDGFEFLREFSRMAGHDRTPVVAMTGLAVDGDRDPTRLAGFAGLLSKPFDDAALVSAVRDALEQRSERRGSTASD